MYAWLKVEGTPRHVRIEALAARLNVKALPEVRNKRTTAAVSAVRKAHMSRLVRKIVTLKLNFLSHLVLPRWIAAR